METALDGTIVGYTQVALAAVWMIDSVVTGFVIRAVVPAMLSMTLLDSFANESIETTFANVDKVVSGIFAKETFSVKLASVLPEDTVVGFE